MKVYVLRYITYDYSEIEGVFADYWTAENYIVSLIINDGRSNISDKAIRQRLLSYVIGEYDVL